MDVKAIKKQHQKQEPIDFEEVKKIIRQTQPKEDESLSEWQFCRKYSKTRSMGQE